MLVKSKEETYEKIIEMSINNNYANGNLFDYEYFSKHYKLIGIDLSKQIESEDPDLKQQINFIGKIEEDEATMSLIIEKPEETNFGFSQNSVLSYKLQTQKIISLLNDLNNEESKFSRVAIGITGALLK